MILQPTKEHGGYTWDGLEVKQSKEKGAGDGVFATRNLKVGTMIPILGKSIDVSRIHEYTHGWTYRTKKAVDGHPSLNPYKKVGNKGLSIAMMVNESTKRKFNCKFKLDHIVVALPIKKGSELTVDYGYGYEPTREQMGYSLDGNKYRDAEYPALLKVKFPSANVRNDNINHWNDVINHNGRSSARPKFGDSKPVLISIKSGVHFPGRSG